MVKAIDRQKNNVYKRHMAMTTVVTWTQDSSSRYEISSKEHLTQLMQNGTLYTNEGTTPADFMDAHFVQTVDIDLLSDSTNIKPIGTFGGIYDGNNRTISNWSYLDPNFDTTDHSESFVGMFGSINGATLKNISFAGVCTIRGFSISAGMVVADASGSTIYNIKCNFSPGSFIEQGHTEDISAVYAGGVIGKTFYGTVTAIQLRGEMDRISCKFPNEAEIGGIAARFRRSTTTLLMNTATFKNTLTGDNVGGLVGNSLEASATRYINAMTGSINGNVAGGIFGQCTQKYTSQSAGDIVNSMTGDIAGGVVGGICGFMDMAPGGGYARFMNYMRGNISSTNQNSAGGILGGTYDGAKMASSINAMNGDVYHTVVGLDNIAGVPDLVYVDTSFGMTFTIDKYNTNTPVTGLDVDPSTNLPIVDLTATDGDGVTHTYDFVFANFVLFETVPRPLNVTVSFGAAEGAIAYELTVQKTGVDTGFVRTVDTGFTETTKKVTSLIPETEYVFKVYSTTDGTQYDLYLQRNETTLSHSSENFNVTDYADATGRFNLSDIDAASSASVLKVAKNLFTTGDVVIVPVKKTKTNAKFVNLGDTVSIVGEDALLFPFEEDGGASQSAAISLSDDSTVTLAFDDTSGTIDFGGATYSAGDSLVVDSLKLTFVEL